MKKRLISCLVLALMLLMTVLPIFTANAVIGPMYVNTSNKKSLNLRAEPSTDAEILTTIPYGTLIQDYQYYDNSWGFVSYGGYYGYAMSRYFSSSKPSGGGGGGGGGGSTDTNLFKKFVTADYYVTVNPSTPSGFVNCRWAPSQNDAIQTTYHAGKLLHVISQNEKWAQVYDEENNSCGFMSRYFLINAAVGASVGAKTN